MHTGFDRAEYVRVTSQCRTRQNDLSEVFNVGRYVDVVRRTADGLRFASRICVFDSEMIPTSIIYPI